MKTSSSIITYLVLASLFSLHINSIRAICCQPGPSECAPCGQATKSCGIGVCDGYPYLLTRPQGRNAARDLVGEQAFVHTYETDETYATVSLAVEYQRSFWPDQIARFFFGDDLIDCCNLCIQGSQVENRHSKAWLADYFGLPMDFESKVNFCPRIQNAIFDINIYADIGECTDGLYVKFDLPLVWTKWELNPCEKICNKGEMSFPASYMAKEEIAREDLSSSFLQFMSGKKIFGDMKHPIQYGRITKCEHKKVRLAEIRSSLGYDFVGDEDYHFGFFVQLSIPTGNRRSSRDLFCPVVGNGRHWEFGGGVSGSWIFHRSCEHEDRYVGIWLDATITHLFKTCQCRSFDFTCKPNSRYMLLEKMGNNLDMIQTATADSGGNISGNKTKAEYQYNKHIETAINWTTFRVDVQMDLQADIAVKLGFVRDGWSFDVGYNFWAMTGEKFDQYCCTREPAGCRAIKGDAFIYGFDEKDSFTPIAISATQSLANIHSGKNYPEQNNDFPITNPRVDNPNNPLSSVTAPVVGTDVLTWAGENNLVASDNAKVIRTSMQPILLKIDDINLNDGPTAMTHKIFAHINYAWLETEKCWTPFLGLGGQVEFAKNRCKQCCKKCDNKYCSSSYCYSYDDCCDIHCNKRAGVSQWGIWLKGGLNFD